MTVEARRLLVAVVATLMTAPASAGWKEVQIEISVPARVKTTGDEQVLVALFRSNTGEFVDAGLEIARWARRVIVRDAKLTVLDVPPPAIPEQRPEQLAVNDAFWRRLGEDFKADLIVAGVAEFKIEDRSGFVTEDYTSPVTGQTVRRSRFADRRGYRLRIEIFFLNGDNGALLHADTWSEEMLVEGAGGDDLSRLYELLEGMAGPLRATLSASTVAEPRYIWVE